MIAVLIIAILIIYFFLFSGSKECMTDKFYYAGANLNFNSDPASNAFNYINIKEDSIDVPDHDSLVKKDLYDYKTRHYKNDYNYFALE